MTIKLINTVAQITMCDVKVVACSDKHREMIT